MLHTPPKLIKQLPEPGHRSSGGLVGLFRKPVRSLVPSDTGRFLSELLNLADHAEEAGAA